MSTNSLCSEKNKEWKDINDLDSCKDATKESPTSQNDSMFPKGCYEFKNQFFFNTHSTGSRELNSSPMCELG